jgi:uncharacterized protein (DUF934 family)
MTDTDSGSNGSGSEGIGSSYVDVAAAVDGEETSLKQRGSSKPYEDDAPIPSTDDSKQLGERQSLRKRLEQYIPIRAVDVVLWDNVKVSLSLLACGSILLVLLNTLSFISVFAYLNLCILAAAYTLRMYTSIQQTIQATPQIHPLQAWLQKDVEVNSERANDLAESLAPVVEAAARQMRSIVLLEKPMTTIKFAAVMYGLTFIGAVLNLLTLVSVTFVALFTLPVIYDKKQAEVDALFGLALQHICKASRNAYSSIEPKLQQVISKLPPSVLSIVDRFSGKTTEKLE